MPESKKRKKKGSPRGTPASQRKRKSGPEALRSILQLASELAALEDPLDAECWISGLLAPFAKRPDDEARDAFITDLTKLCRTSRTPEALAILDGFALIAPRRLAKAAADASDVVRIAGVEDPPWAAMAGHADFAGAWLVSDPFGDQNTVMIAFARPGEPDHCFSALIDHTLGGVMKDLFCFEELEKAVALAREDVNVTLDEISGAEAAGRLRTALAVNDGFAETQATHEYDNYRYLLDARIRDLPDTWATPTQPHLMPAAREALIAEFLTSPHGEGIDTDDAWFVLQSIVDYGCDIGGGDPLRWSPSVAATFMLDWIPRSSNPHDEDIDRTPTVVRAWVRFAGERRGLASELIDHTCEAVSAMEADFYEAARDPSRFGPGKSLVQAMIADGVEVGDQAAMDRWLEKFNAKSIEERRKIIP